MRTAMRLTALGLAGALALAGCSGSGSSDSADAPADAGAFDESGGVAPEEAAAEPEGGFDVGSDLPSADLGDTTGDGDADRSDENIEAAGRSVITEGTVGIVVDDPQGVSQQITAEVGRLGGWVEGVTYRAATEFEGAQATLVARIPSGEVSGALAHLTRYGKIETTDLTRTDVTTQVRDLDARIAAMETSVERMAVFLRQAGNRQELLEAEQMYTDRLAQLEVLRTQKAGLSSQVSMSTLTIQLWSPEAAPEPEEPEPEVTGFWAGLTRGWNAFYEFGSDALLVIGALLPWLIFLGLLLALIMFAARPIRRWRAEVAAARPPRPVPPPRPMPLGGPPQGDPYHAQQYPQGAAPPPPQQQQSAPTPPAPANQGPPSTPPAGQSPPPGKTPRSGKATPPA